MIKKSMKKIFVLVAVISLCVVFISSCGQSKKLIKSSVSPDGKYTVEAYLLEGNATVDFSVKAYSDKKLIYNEYHQEKADIKWINDDTVSINGKSLDLSKGETYDWRN